MKLSKILSSTGKWIGLILVAAIFALLFGIYWQVTKGESADYDALKQAIIQYGNDLNEMRSELLLPQQEYNFFKSEAVMSEEQKEVEKDISYLEGVKKFTEGLMTEKELAKKRAGAQKMLENVLREPRFASELKNLNLTFNKQLETDEQFSRLKILAGKNTVAQVSFNAQTSQFLMQSILGTEKLTPSSDMMLREQVVNYLTENTETILKRLTDIPQQKEALVKLWQETELQDLLKKNYINLKAEPVETEAGFEYYFNDMDGSPLLTLTLDRKAGQFKLQQKTFSTTEELKPALISSLKTLNGQTENMKEIQAIKTDLETYFQSDEFTNALQKTGLIVSPVREENSKAYYDLVYGALENQEKLGSIVFDYISGEVTFIKGGDQTELSVEEVLSGSKKNF